MCGSRRELSNEYLLAKIRFDTAENEPSGDLDLTRCDEVQLRAGRRQTPQAAGLDEAEHALDRRTKLLEPSGLLIWTN